jgi:hypothetical protein
MLTKKVYEVRTVLCPVCAALLGQRRFDQHMVFFCEECNYFWKFISMKRLPVALKNEPVILPRCGCGRCGR